MCRTPLTIKNKIPQITSEGVSRFRVVPCGKCYQCLSRRQRAWTFRLLQQAKDCTSCSFITLTYNDKHLPYSPSGFPSLKRRDYTDFMKRLRKKINAYYPNNPKLKYYACGEYGGETHRPHFHAIMYNLPLDHVTMTDMDAETNTVTNNNLKGTWQKGHVDVVPGNEGTMAYVAKYIMKKTYKDRQIIDYDSGEVLEDDREPEYSVMSKKLGLNYLTDQTIKHHKDNEKPFIHVNGHPMALPRYFKERLFSKPQRRVMARLAADLRREQLEQDDLINITLSHDKIRHEEYIHKRALKLRRKI